MGVFVYRGLVSCSGLQVWSGTFAIELRGFSKMLQFDCGAHFMGKIVLAHVIVVACLNADFSLI
jgi:hypothetical protein